MQPRNTQQLGKEILSGIEIHKTNSFKWINDPITSPSPPPGIPAVVLEAPIVSSDPDMPPNAAVLMAHLKCCSKWSSVATAGSRHPAIALPAQLSSQALVPGRSGVLLFRQTSALVFSAVSISWVRTWYPSSISTIS